MNTYDKSTARSVSRLLPNFSVIYILSVMQSAYSNLRQMLKIHQLATSGELMEQSELAETTTATTKNSASAVRCCL